MKTSKDIKICSSSIICRTDIKHIDGKINKTISHLKNYCKQQNLAFINNNTINNSDLAVKRLYFKERGSSKLAKKI